jgi:hypothetical protein
MVKNRKGSIEREKAAERKNKSRVNPENENLERSFNTQEKQKTAQRSSTRSKDLLIYM